MDDLVRRRKGQRRTRHRPRLGAADSDATAAILRGENGDRREWTYAQISEQVAAGKALVALGVEPGDRVAIFMPMAPAMAVASHACAHIGAIQVPIFSGFAAPAVAQRLQDSEAKVLLTANHSCRRGRETPMRAIADEAVALAPSVERIVEWTARRASGTSSSGLELPPLEVDSEHPYLLTYTSGTTGKPKGVLHVQGGFLVSIAREVAYQADGHPRRHPLRHRHGLDHGAVDGRRRRRDGLFAGLHGGRARLAEGPALEADRGGTRRTSSAALRRSFAH